LKKNLATNLHELGKDSRYKTQDTRLRTQRHEKGLIFSQEKAQNAQKEQKNDQKVLYLTANPFDYFDKLSVNKLRTSFLFSV